MAQIIGKGYENRTADKEHPQAKEQEKEVDAPREQGENTT